MATNTKKPETNHQGIDTPMVQETTERLVISAPQFRETRFLVRGTSPYLQNRFSHKALVKMREKMEKGESAKKGSKRNPRDFLDDYESAMHRTEDGRYGQPAAGYRNAAIDACRMAGFQMTRAKMSLFVLADAYDAVDKTPLVILQSLHGPEPTEMPVRNQSGVADIRVRPMWMDWWTLLTVRFDADQFSTEDVLNLFLRAGMQVGVGEGRPFSKDSNGMGFGLFTIEPEPAQE